MAALCFARRKKTSIETADTGPLTYLIYQLGSAHYVEWRNKGNKEALTISF